MSDPATKHANRLDATAVTDAERADMLAEYLDHYESEFGAVPELMPLAQSGKAPALKTEGVPLDSDRAEELLTPGRDAVSMLRADGHHGFGFYAGNPDHGTGGCAVVDHDDMAAFPAPSGPPTLEVRTGSGRGVHETYRNGGDVGGTSVGDGEGEVRANNEFVVLPGAVHPSGGVYHVETTREISTLVESDLPPKATPSGRQESTHVEKRPKNVATDASGIVYDADAAAVVESALREFQQSERTTTRAFKHVMGLARGHYAEWDHGDRSTAEFSLVSKLMGILRWSRDADDARKRVGSFVDKMCNAHPRTDDGSPRKWVERSSDGYQRCLIDDAIATFNQDAFDRWRARKSDPYRHTGEYSDVTFRIVLVSVRTAYEERPGYPSPSDVVDVAQGFDGSRSRDTHREALRRLQRERGQVKMARVGRDYVYYPKRENDPSNAAFVKLAGEKDGRSGTWHCDETPPR